MGTTFTPAYAAEARRLWDAMEPIRKGAIDEAARKIIAKKAVFLRVSARTGIPWPWLGAILDRESGLRTDRHYHNGDKLTARTVNVPRGRLPAPAQPPFSFDDSAWDALCVLKGLHKIADWSIERQAYEAERYNGFGYRNVYGLRSPYLWGGTNQQQPGKYVRDGVFDWTVMDQQLGVMALIRRVGELDATPEVPDRDDLHEVAEQHDMAAKADTIKASTSVGGGALAGGVAPATPNPLPHVPADQAAGIDWASVACWGLAVVALVVAVYFVARVIRSRTHATELRAAASALPAYQAARTALPVPSSLAGEWSQTAP